MLPILYQSNSLILYSYPLFMGLGWGVAYQIYFSLFEKNFSHLKAQILFWGVFLSSWIGAKLFFLITFDNPENQNFITNVSFWTGGGFVFYGGLILAFAFLGIFSFVDRSINVRVLWPMVPALALGHGIGRIGCFLAGCCFGKPTEFFWGVYMHDHYRHPTQLIEAIVLLALGVFMTKSKRTKSELVAIYFMGYGFLRFVIEALRGDLVRGNWGPLTPSQWISFVLVIAGLTLYVRNKSKVLA